MLYVRRGKQDGNDIQRADFGIQPQQLWLNRKLLRRMSFNRDLSVTFHSWRLRETRLRCHLECWSTTNSFAHHLLWDIDGCTNSKNSGAWFVSSSWFYTGCHRQPWWLDVKWSYSIVYNIGLVLRLSEDTWRPCCHTRASGLRVLFQALHLYSTRHRQRCVYVKDSLVLSNMDYRALLISYITWGPRSLWSRKEDRYREVCLWLCETPVCRKCTWEPRPSNRSKTDFALSFTRTEVVIWHGCKHSGVLAALPAVDSRTVRLWGKPSSTWWRVLDTALCVASTAVVDRCSVTCKASECDMAVLGRSKPWAHHPLPTYLAHLSRCHTSISKLPPPIANLHHIGLDSVSFLPFEFEWSLCLWDVIFQSASLLPLQQ